MNNDDKNSLNLKFDEKQQVWSCDISSITNDINSFFTKCDSEVKKIQPHIQSLLNTFFKDLDENTEKTNENKITECNKVFAIFKSNRITIQNQLKSEYPVITLLQELSKQVEEKKEYYTKNQQEKDKSEIEKQKNELFIKATNECILNSLDIEELKNDINPGLAKLTKSFKGKEPLNNFYEKNIKTIITKKLTERIQAKDLNDNKIRKEEKQKEFDSKFNMLLMELSFVEGYETMQPLFYAIQHDTNIEEIINKAREDILKLKNDYDRKQNVAVFKNKLASELKKNNLDMKEFLNHHIILWEIKSDTNIEEFYKEKNITELIKEEVEEREASLKRIQEQQKQTEEIKNITEYDTEFLKLIQNVINSYFVNKNKSKQEVFKETKNVFNKILTEFSK